MDQVITLMDKQLAPFSGDGERLLTSSMINNYVKDGVLPRPESKKYSRNHLAMLLMICMLKSVLSLPEIHNILEGMTAGKGVEDLYPAFTTIHRQAMQEAASRIDAAREQDTAALYQLAMTMALEANACLLYTSPLVTVQPIRERLRRVSPSVLEALSAPHSGSRT